MLREYQSKPVSVLACMIEDTGIVTKKKAGEYEYTHKGRGASTTLLVFSASEKQVPEVGDFIIKLSDEDIYLCKAGVFCEKYNVRGMYIR